MRRVVICLVIAGILAIVYYLFFVPYEFEVKFKAKTLPGDVIQTVRIWSRSLGEKSRIVKVDGFSQLTQELNIEGRRYIYAWNFDVVNDSILKINVRITEPDRRFLNKALVPFTAQTIEKDAEELLKRFHEILVEHLKITRVRVIGETEIDSSFCLCRALATDQIDKANGMMRDFPALTSFITAFGLKSAGRPSVRVLAWDHEKGSLQFQFCFPIVKSDTLPLTTEFSYHSFKSSPAIKAEYNGNYITSDRAWYELIKYAEKNGYETDGFPIEYFHDNPNLGMRETEWRADIYLPVKRKKL